MDPGNLPQWLDRGKGYWASDSPGWLFSPGLFLFLDFLWPFLWFKICLSQSHLFPSVHPALLLLLSNLNPSSSPSSFLPLILPVFPLSPSLLFPSFSMPPSTISPISPPSHAFSASHSLSPHHPAVLVSQHPCPSPAIPYWSHELAGCQLRTGRDSVTKVQWDLVGEQRRHCG